jgi:ribosomal protein S12 methylthiotransferase accessory factor
MTKIFFENEGSLSAVYKKIWKVVNPDFGVLKSFRRVLQYYDEPKFWQYSALLKESNFTSVASGLSFLSEKVATIKCLCEALERYCNFTFSDKFIECKDSYKRLKNLAIEPEKIVGLSKIQANNASMLNWSMGVDLISSKKILIPTQLIYLSYVRPKWEQMIYPAISTGVAGGSKISGALVRAICEIIERDAFMIVYLNKIQPKRVDVKKINNKRIKKFLALFRRYNMELYSFDITTDMRIPTYLSVVIDRSGLGKAVSTGLKCSFNAIDALIGSIEESFNTRTWLRTEYEDHPEQIRERDLLNKSDIKSRGFLWFPKSAIKNLDFLFESKLPMKPISRRSKSLTSGEQLRQLIQILKDKKYDVVYKDISLPKLGEVDYHVVKVLIPQMQPFYLDERYKLLGGERLYSVPRYFGYTTKKEAELNDFPHPFL